MLEHRSIDRCIDDAIKRLSSDNGSVNEQECEIFVWPQTWEDTSCGAGGLCGQAITTASTVVVVGPTEEACVYHGGRLAYQVSVDDDFRRAIDNKQLPGKVEGWKQQNIKANS